MPSSVVYKGKGIYASWTTGGPAECKYAHSDCNCIIGDFFESRMKESFVSHISEHHKPVFLFFNRNGLHLMFTIVKAVMDNQIVIICLLPHTSNALQMLDVAVFTTLKDKWH